MIEVTNKVVPILSDYVEDDVILKQVPPQYRDAKTITLLDKAGAKELSNLFRKIQPELAASMIVVPVAAVAAPVAAAPTPALLPVEIVVAEEPVAPVVAEYLIHIKRAARNGRSFYMSKLDCWKNSENGTELWYS